MNELVQLERQEGGWHLVPPGCSAEVALIWWQSVNDWAAAGSSGVPTTTVTVIVRDATGGAVDECELMFGAQVLTRRPRQDGWCAPARDMRTLVADPPALPVMRIGTFQRSYPVEPSSRVGRRS